MRQALPPALLAGALTLVFLLCLELRFPYYFLEDDNRVIALPSLLTCWRSVAGGGFSCFNFHQFLGVEWLAGSAAFYPLTYAGLWLSRVFCGDFYSAVDIATVIHLCLAGTGAGLLLGFLGFSAGAVFFGGILWSLNPFLVLVGRNWWVVPGAGAYFPLMLLGLAMLLRKPGAGAFILLVAARALFMFLGYPQYFVYALVFEFLFALLLTGGAAIAGGGLVCPGRRSGFTEIAVFLRRLGADILKNNRRFWVFYGWSLAVSLTLALPVIVPILMAAGVSAERGGSFSFADFANLNLSLVKWLAGLLWPFAAIRKNEFVPMDKISHLGYVPILIFAAGVVLRRKIDVNRKYFPVFAALGVIALLGALGIFNPLEFALPLFNRFRWHFKLLFFFSFFSAMACAALLDGLTAKIPGRRVRAAAVLGALVCVNMWVFFTRNETVVFREHGTLIKPSAATLAKFREWRIFSLGFPWQFPETRNSAAFNYATLWQWNHFGGYHILAPKELAAETFNMSYEAVFTEILTPEKLARLRRWGVRWYFVDSQNLARHEKFLSENGMVRLPAVAEFPGAVIFEDGAASPMAGPGLDYEICGGSLRVSVRGDNTGGFKSWLNFHYSPWFYSDAPGVQAAAGPDGVVALRIPPGVKAFSIKVKSPYLSAGLKAFGLSSLVLVSALALYWRRKK